MQTKSDVSALFLNPQTPGTVLLCLLVDEFGTEFFDWEPETLALEIRNHWKVTPPTVNRDKVWALVTAMTTNLFYSNLDAFMHICNALNDSGADFENFDPATITDIAWAIAELSLIDPPTAKDKSYVFADDILAYMQAELDREGFSKPPRILATYLKPIDNEERLNSVLEGDGIEFKGYWDDQNHKRLDVEQYVSQRLASLLALLSSVPLQHADREAVQELRQRADKALGAQSRSIQQERESAPQSKLL